MNQNSAMRARSKTMLQKISQFLRSTSGNIGIMFGLTLMPAVLMIGAAIDYSRASADKATLSIAMDSAILALARQDPMNDDDARAYLENHINATLEGANFSGAWELTEFSQSNTVVTATAVSSVDTAFMGIAGFEQIDMGVLSEVVREQSRVELALVLDNTGSMGSNNKIGALRDAATALVDIMYESETAEEKVKIALVPFVTAVNVRADTGFSMNWIDQTGAATWNGVNFDKAAHHLELFDRISNAEWKGCVEARAEPYDLQDTAPDVGTPDTLWVPWFWPDEPDRGSGYSNNYMGDNVSRRTSSRNRQLRQPERIDRRNTVNDLWTEQRAARRRSSR